ncbi:MAG TPA: TonB-dependent receptor, partial [Opitutaceae bacterium]|nr:TonB-dependent receptor [Opitutaceae bacterium]
VSDTNDPPFSIVVGRSRSRGLEIEVPATFTQRWRGIINYTYLDTGVVRDPLIPIGTPLVNAPEHSASLWTSYDFDGAWDGVTAVVGVLHIGERAATSTDTIRIPGYTRIDMSLGYGFDTVIGRVKTQLTIQNVGSEFYYDSGGSFLPVFPGAPRTVTFSASVRF